MLRLLASPECLAECASLLDAIDSDQQHKSGGTIHRIPFSLSLETSELASIDAAVLLYHEHKNKPLLAAITRQCTALRVLSVGWVGVDGPMFDKLRSRGVQILNSAGVNAAPIAQSVLGGLLMLRRGFVQWGQAQRGRLWRPLPDRPSLSAQTALIFGYGHIGREICRLFKPLGMHVVGVRRSVGHDDFADEIIHPELLLQNAARADVFVACAPLTEQTRRAVSREVLDKLPASCILISVGRGGVVDQDALIEMLMKKRLRGAYLDVFEVCMNSDYMVTSLDLSGRLVAIGGTTPPRIAVVEHGFSDHQSARLEWRGL